MKYKKHIIGFLLLIFSFAIANSFGNATVCFKFQKKQNEQTSIVFENNKTNNNQNIVSIEGALQSSIRSNENNSFRFHSFKKYSVFNLFTKSVLGSTSYFTFYRLYRTNEIKFSPLYIAHHRLLI